MSRLARDFQLFIGHQLNNLVNRIFDYDSWGFHTQSETHPHEKDKRKSTPSA
jgi:hypothetical protein